MASEFQELFTLALDHASSPSLSILKERFKGFEHCNDKATAAAFGYFAAMRDGEKEEETDEPGVFDHICAVMDQLIDPDKHLVAEEATEITMGLIYKWLHNKLKKDGYDDNDYTITFIKSLFAPCVKPGVIL